MIPVAGTVVWLAAVLALPLSVIEALFLWAPLVVLPLALDAIPAKRFRLPAFGGALFAVASFLPAPGALAGALAGGWALVTFALAGLGASRFFRRSRWDPAEACIDAGLLLLTVAGAGLVMSRAGLNPAGFKEPIVLLTAVHFHYTGFTAPLLAGLAARKAGPRRSILLAGAMVLAATPALAVGFTLHAAALKLAAVLTIASGLVILSMELVWIAVSLPRARPRVLMGISAFSIFWGMTLAILYGVGEAFGLPLIGIQEMAWSHGILNAFGFATCGVLAARG